MKDRTKLWDETHFQKELEKLPPRLQQDIQNIPFKKTTKELTDTFIYGTTGTGKTVQAVHMMLNELRNCFVRRYHTVGTFISVPELLLEFKNSYNKQNGEEGKTEADLVNYYGSIKILVLDDIGVERTTDWAFQLLYIIINRRYENMLQTVFTSNISLNELAGKLKDDRIPARIQQMCTIVKSKDVNYRVREGG